MSFGPLDRVFVLWVISGAFFFSIRTGFNDVVYILGVSF